MSKAGSYWDGSSSPPVETITGNVGGAVGPDGAFNIDLIGDPGTNGINVTGAPGSNSLTIAMSSPFVGTWEFQNAGTSGVTDDIFTLTNTTATVADGGSAALWKLTASDAVAYAAGRIAVLSDASTWTSTVASQDSYMSFQTCLNGTVGTKAILSSTGYLTLDAGGVQGNYKLSFGDDGAAAFNKLALSEQISSGNFFYGIGVSAPSGNNEGVSLWGGCGNAAPDTTNCSVFIHRIDTGTGRGYVGIGTGNVSPTAQLDIEEAGVSGTTNDQLTITNTTQTVADGGSAILWNLHASDDNPYAAGRIAVLSDASTWTSTGTTQDSYMSFQTALNGSVGETLRLDSYGKTIVTSTNYGGSVYYAMLLQNSSAGAGDGTAIALTFSSANSPATTYAKIGILAEITSSYTRGKLHLCTENTTSITNVSLTDAALTVDEAGLIGIRTTTPITTLDVAGKIRATDALFVDEFWNGQAPEWATDVTTGSVAAQARQNGWLRLTTGATATNEESLDWGDITVCVNTLRPMVEVRLDLEQITLLEVEVGLKESEAVGTDDYIMIAFDPSAQNTWFLQASNAGATTTDQGAVADTNEVLLRFEFTSDTALEWFIDDVSQGTIATNVPTVALQPFIRIRTEENAAHYVDFDYFKCYQDRT